MGTDLTTVLRARGVQPSKLAFRSRMEAKVVEHCALFATTAMLGMAWVAVKTGHPDKIRLAWVWISLN